VTLRAPDVIRTSKKDFKIEIYQEKMTDMVSDGYKFGGTCD